jgi:methylenetetrahydrofolate dehydrogenase (NADP+)/methenyltetrahydrofolate cyclohydrolase
MAKLLSGTIARDAMVEKLKKEVHELGLQPTLVILQIGDRPDSNAYITQKKKFAEKIGAKVNHERYPDTISQEILLETIKKYNNDPTINGIIVQIPLPKHLNKDILIDSIDPKKDVDGLTTENTKYLYENREGGFIPATTRGILNLLKFYNISIKGKKITVVGRSNLVGKPTALALLNAGATVMVGHLETKDLPAITKPAEILVVAIGDPEFINEKYVSPGQTVIDVGINSVEGKKFDEEIDTPRKLVGDVDFTAVEPIVEAITPVPGGVGPMTVASLFENLVEAAKKR